MVCRPYHFIFFKGYLPQILLGPFLNTLSHITITSNTYQLLKKRHKSFRKSKRFPAISGFVLNELIHKDGNNWNLKNLISLIKKLIGILLFQIRIDPGAAKLQKSCIDTVKRARLKLHNSLSKILNTILKFSKTLKVH